MKNDLEAKNGTPNIIFDWGAFMRFVMDTPGERRKIGPAWQLFFDICLNVDRTGMFSSTYIQLGKRYGVSPITVKKWRRYLSRSLVIESFNRGRFVAFRLQEPFLSFLQDFNKNDQVGYFLLQKVLKAIKEESLSHAA